MYQELHSWVRDYIDNHCIIRGANLPGKKPGTKYSWMFYLRRGLFNHEFLSAVSQMFCIKIQEEVKHFNFQLAGLETASTPMLAGIPLVARVYGLDLNAFSVRAERKTYGLKNWFEGLPNEKPVLMVDDLCNSAISMRRCYDLLTQHNIPVLDYAFVIVNKTEKQFNNNTDKYLPNHIKMISLFNLDDFGLGLPI